MPGHRITLTGEKQTLLITLYAKALDSRLDDSILHDRFAEEAVRQIDFDFSRVAL
ncbi:TPA: class I SAM-dependent methyltransferase, partial [Pseudomonas aeruginosa]